MISTGLRGFAASTRVAVTALSVMFGSSEFYYRQAINECRITPKEFAKLRTGGVIVKIGKCWPARWRLAQRYASAHIALPPSSALNEVT